MNNIFKNILTRRLSTLKLPGSKVKVNDIDIHYEKIGNGSQILLMLPGACGTTRMDFRAQLDELNGQKLTLIAWDPPGYGFSRPPNRNFTLDFYRKDAELAAALMKTLNYDKYSILGWSDGGTTGLIMASQNPNEIYKLITLAAQSFITKKDIDLVEAIRDLSVWHENTKRPYIEMYGEEYFKLIWTSFCDVCFEISKRNEGNICREELEKIKCETLIVHGEKDSLVDSIHPQYLKDNIKNSRLIKFEKGKHNLQYKYHKQINQLIEDFILQ